MYVHNLDPIIFSLGPFALRWYGLVYALGFLYAYYHMERAAKKGTIPLSVKASESYISLLIILSIVCARLVYVIVYNPLYYFHNPLHIFAVWQGGLSFHGGFLGAILATLWIQKKHKVSFYSLADSLVIPFSLVLVFGRIANFINGELVGSITNVSWCVVFPGIDGCRHPYQLYAALSHLLIFGILLYLLHRKKTSTQESIFHKEGVFFWTFVLLYGVFRFITDVVRTPDSTDPLFLGILLGQWLCIVMIVCATFFLVKIVKSSRSAATSEQRSDTKTLKSNNQKKNKQAKHKNIRNNKT